MRTLRSALFALLGVALAMLGTAAHSLRAQQSAAATAVESSDVEIIIRQGDIVSWIMYRLALDATTWRDPSVVVWRKLPDGARVVIAKNNDYRDIRPGDVLRVPRKFVRTLPVKANVPLIAELARKYSSSPQFAALLARINRISVSDTITGREVYVPVYAREKLRAGLAEIARLHQEPVVRQQPQEPKALAQEQQQNTAAVDTAPAQRASPVLAGIRERMRNTQQGLFGQWKRQLTENGFPGTRATAYKLAGLFLFVAAFAFLLAARRGNLTVWEDVCVFLGLIPREIAWRKKFKKSQRKQAPIPVVRLQGEQAVVAFDSGSGQDSEREFMHPSTLLSTLQTPYSHPAEVSDNGSFGTNQTVSPPTGPRLVLMDSASAHTDQDSDAAYPAARGARPVEAGKASAAGREIIRPMGVQQEKAQPGQQGHFDDPTLKFRRPASS